MHLQVGGEAAEICRDGGQPSVRAVHSHQHTIVLAQAGSRTVASPGLQGGVAEQQSQQQG